VDQCRDRRVEHCAAETLKSVGGNLIVQNGAAAPFCCEAEHFACLDDPNPEASPATEGGPLGPGPF